jgi:hypothetical protein
MNTFTGCPEKPTAIARQPIGSEPLGWFKSGVLTIAASVVASPFLFKRRHFFSIV